MSWVRVAGKGGSTKDINEEHKTRLGGNGDAWSVCPPNCTTRCSGRRRGTPMATHIPYPVRNRVTNLCGAGIGVSDKCNEGKSMEEGWNKPVQIMLQA